MRSVFKSDKMEWDGMGKKEEVSKLRWQDNDNFDKILNIWIIIWVLKNKIKFNCLTIDLYYKQHQTQSFGSRR